MTAFSSLTGRLLVAMPGIDDDRFRHAVILICAHGPDHAMGLRLDRPAPGVDLKTVLDKLDAPAPDQSIGRAVLMGGPVERERGFVLHTDDWKVDATSIPFGQGLALWWALTSGHDGDESDLPHRFLYFPDENHWVLSPQHAIVWYESVLGFAEAVRNGTTMERPSIL